MPPASSIVTPGIANLFDQTLTADAASIDTGAVIPGGYSTLVIALSIRGSAASSNFLMRFNNDSGANYRWGNVFNAVTSGGGGQNSGATGGGIAFFDATAGVGANEPAVSQVSIPNYAGASFAKGYTSFSYYAGAGTNWGASQYGGYWNNTAPITRLQFLFASGNIKSGSRLTIYGMV